MFYGSMPDVGTRWRRTQRDTRHSNSTHVMNTTASVTSNIRGSIGCLFLQGRDQCGLWLSVRHITVPGPPCQQNLDAEQARSGRDVVRRDEGTQLMTTDRRLAPMDRARWLETAARDAPTASFPPVAAALRSARTVNAPTGHGRVTVGMRRPVHLLLSPSPMAPGRRLRTWNACGGIRCLGDRRPQNAPETRPREFDGGRL
jgi:hypothetical protein